MFSNARDPASEIATRYAAANTAATAGGSGDATEVTGVTITQSGLATLLGKRFEGIAFSVSATATLAAAATLTVTAKIEHRDPGGSWTDLVASKTILTLLGGSGGTTERGTGVIDVSLEYAKDEIRIKFTPDLSASNTDTAALSCQAILTGADRRP
ncbi:MAG: hypothetical protein KBC46_03445 [Ferrovibrio sp.]|nr:hypothetical protein [Ferrovibrio sp.]